MHYSDQVIRQGTASAVPKNDAIKAALAAEVKGYSTDIWRRSKTNLRR